MVLNYTHALILDTLILDTQCAKVRHASYPFSTRVEFLLNENTFYTMISSAA